MNINNYAKINTLHIYMLDKQVQNDIHLQHNSYYSNSIKNKYILPPRYNWNIVENGIQHHNLNLNSCHFKVERGNKSH
jgi:hypothetical protein